MVVGPEPVAAVTERAAQSQSQVTEAVTVRGMAAAFNRRSSQRNARIDVILLSSGGQWGAFSAGFMNGWSANTSDPRPARFEVVTGVSTGALQAPFVFGGQKYDGALKKLYYGLQEREVLRRRNKLELLSAPSIWDPKPLERSVRRELTRGLINEIAQAASTRSLLVGAVNLDTGFFEAFDLTAMAGSGAPETPDCLREGLLASAAIPIAFPPRQIDSQLYVDGAARQGLFLRSLARADLQPTVYILVNNAVSFPAESPEFALSSIVGRVQSVVTDELLRNSAIEAVRFAKSQGWTVRGMVAPDVWPGADCFQEDGSELAFCPSFTRHLFDTGYSMAVNGKIRWLGADALIAEMQRQNAAQRARIN